MQINSNMFLIPAAGSATFRISFPLDDNEVARLYQVQYMWGKPSGGTTGGLWTALTYLKKWFNLTPLATGDITGIEYWACARASWELVTTGGRHMVLQQVIPLLGIDAGPHLYASVNASGGGTAGVEMKVDIWWEPVDVGNKLALAVRAREGT